MSRAVRGSLPVWHGTAEERGALLRAIARFCTCDHAISGARTSLCSTHELLLDQASLDRLLFARRLATRLVAEEERCRA